MDIKIMSDEKNTNDSDRPVFYHSLNELDQDITKVKPKFNVTKLNSSDLINGQLENTLPEYSELGLTGFDSVPDRDNYRNLMSLTGEAKSRPTLIELQNYQRLSTTDTDSVQKAHDLTDSVDFKTKENQKQNDVIKFGWIKGVLIRCVLNIFGVMIFLRVSWLVGQAGVLLMTVIILLATLVTVITTLSTSAICTNGEIRGGGAYYLISRSLGPEFGGAIGIVFSFANAVGCAMYTIGFAETLVTLLWSFNIKIDSDPINDMRLIGLITIIILFIVALVGMSWEAKVQIFLLGILIIAFINFIVGTFLKPTKEKLSKGFVGYSFGQLRENFWHDFRDGEDFAHLFGVFFPAVTGILAGANISGNLKNPQKAIPKGTLLSIVITSTVYLIFSWMCGASIVREATGNLFQIENNSFLDCKNFTCKEGLLHNYQIMQMVSLWSPIITAGIFSASLSSALASLVSAPKVFQAVCEDKIFPKIDYFAVGRGKDNEPFRGYVLTFVIASAFILVGDLNAIAPIISNFFLMSYALINYSCFDASLAKTPGWRPAFKYYNKWVSLFGALLCITVMFLIKWWAALISFIIIAGLHLYVKQSKPNINWGSSTQAHIFRRSLEYSLKLMSIEEHVKNFRPNFLVLTGPPTTRPALCDIVAVITKNRSLMVCANIITDNNEIKYNIDYVSWMHKRKYKSFYSELRSPTLRTGAFSMMQTVGIGKLKPNTLMIGFKNDWQYDKIENVIDYYELINDAFLLQFGICILRLDGGLDYSDLLDNLSNEKEFSSSESESEGDSALSSSVDTDLKKKNIEFLISKQNKSNIDRVIGKNPSYSYLTKFSEKTSELEKSETKVENLTSNKNSFLKSTEVIKLKNTKINKGILQGINIFHHKYQNGFVDVWWTYDDGGLSVLIPYLLLQKKHWQKCKLRIFIQTKNNCDNVSEEQRNLATLLSKFRIEFHDLIVFSTTNKKPQPSTVSIYEKMIENWRLKSNENLEQFPWKISDELYKQNLDKINQQLILKDMLIEYSHNSNFIFITISVPNRLQTCAGLYLSQLDLISYEMPPMMMIRGNQNSVLTYYS